MVLVSKAVATNKKGGVKKGYKVIESKNGRQMYFTDDKKKDVKNKPKEKKTKEKNEPELAIDFE